MYMKHYNQRNDGMLKDANKIWTNLHIERTNMLFAKDNYCNEMCTLNQMKRSLEESKSIELYESP